MIWINFWQLFFLNVYNTRVINCTLNIFTSSGRNWRLIQKECFKILRVALKKSEILISQTNSTKYFLVNGNNNISVFEIKEIPSFYCKMKGGKKLLFWEHKHNLFWLSAISVYLMWFTNLVIEPKNRKLFRKIPQHFSKNTLLSKINNSFRVSMKTYKILCRSIVIICKSLLIEYCAFEWIFFPAITELFYELLKLILLIFFLFSTFKEKN